MWTDQLTQVFMKEASSDFCRLEKTQGSDAMAHSFLAFQWAPLGNSSGACLLCHGSRTGSEGRGEDNNLQMKQEDLGVSGETGKKKRIPVEGFDLKVKTSG